MKIIRSLVLSCLALGYVSSAVTSLEASPVPVKNNYFGSQRTLSLSKKTYPSSGAAVVAAERTHKGWKVTNVKELSEVWRITMKRR